MPQYLTQLRDDIESHLDSKITGDAAVDTFYSSDLLEFIDYIADNERRLGKVPHVYVTVPSFTQVERRGVGTDTLDSVTVWVWVAYHHTRSEEKLVKSVDEIALLTRAYLTQKQFGLSFTNDNTIEDFSVTVQEETDNTVVYSVVGDLSLEVDNAKLIDTYES